MESKKLILILNQSFKSHGFKRQGNNWSSETNELIKVINLQKSNFGNFYYVNYGFILKNLEATNLRMHIFNRLGSASKVENDRISELLNLENRIEDKLREEQLKAYLVESVINKLIKITTENDLISELKNRPHLNDIPLIVKSYLKLL